jgi:hypothetical protein
MSVASSEKLGIMQPGPPGTHRMVLDFSNVVLGFDSMQATVERAEKMVAHAQQAPAFDCVVTHLPQVVEMKARTEVLETELRKKTNVEDRLKAAESNLQSLSSSVEAQFSANDRR